MYHGQIAFPATDPELELQVRKWKRRAEVLEEAIADAHLVIDHAFCRLDGCYTNDHGYCNRCGCRWQDCPMKEHIDANLS